MVITDLADLDAATTPASDRCRTAPQDYLPIATHLEFDFHNNTLARLL